MGFYHIVFWGARCAVVRNLCLYAIKWGEVHILGYDTSGEWRILIGRVIYCLSRYSFRRAK